MSKNAPSKDELPNDAPPNDAHSTTAPATDLDGCQLGDYRILRRLGQGGMAEVYLCEQQSLCRGVAIKVLKPALASDENYVRRFHREAQAAASLVHANIVHIHEVNCIDGYHFIVQEYVPGQNLRQVLEREEALEPAVALMIARQVAIALAKAHAHGIVHRDIKPENILISTDAMVKVADFGLARVTDDRRQIELTEVGVAMGTPLYMSPEQVEGRSVDNRSDIYSLGVTLYHMLAGKPPFDGDTPLSVAVQHLQNEPPALADQRADLPDALCQVVHRMLAKDPAARFDNASDLLDELRDVSLASPPSTWPQDLGLASADADVSVTTARFAETQQLAAVMRQSGSQSESGHSWPWWLTACVLGSCLAWISRPTDPLAPTQAPAELVSVAKKGDIRSQYMRATIVNTEDAWRSVIDFSPDDSAENGKQRYYSLLAKTHLVRLYLKEAKYDLALNELSDLSNLDETEVEFRAFGFAGEAIVYAMQGERELFVDRVILVWPMRQHLQQYQDIVEQLEALARASFLGS
jgi:serine/threonine-protein kinase